VHLDPDVGDREVASLINQCLAELGPADREVLLQNYLYRRPQRDIAATLGVTQQAVAKRIAKARGRLRFNLLQKGIVPVLVFALGLIRRVARAAAPSTEAFRLRTRNRFDHSGTVADTVSAGAFATSDDSDGGRTRDWTKGPGDAALMEHRHPGRRSVRVDPAVVMCDFLKWRKGRADAPAPDRNAVNIRGPIGGMLSWEHTRHWDGSRCHAAVGYSAPHAETLLPARLAMSEPDGFVIVGGRYSPPSRFMAPDVWADLARSPGLPGETLVFRGYPEYGRAMAGAGSGRVRPWQDADAGEYFAGLTQEPVVWPRKDTRQSAFFAYVYDEPADGWARAAERPAWLRPGAAAFLFARPEKPLPRPAPLADFLFDGEGRLAALPLGAEDDGTSSVGGLLALYTDPLFAPCVGLSGDGWDLGHVWLDPPGWQPGAFAASPLVCFLWRTLPVWNSRSSVSRR